MHTAQSTSEKLEVLKFLRDSGLATSNDIARLVHAEFGVTLEHFPLESGPNEQVPGASNTLEPRFSIQHHTSTELLEAHQDS